MQSHLKTPKDCYRALINSHRLRPSTMSDRDLTDEVLSDKARLITSSGIRRMQTKAQVFSLEENAAVRSRLTHTLEVAAYGELVAEKITSELVNRGSLDAELKTPFVVTVENACLLHDMGNPPFGHLGEYAIQNWFEINSDALHEIWLKANVPADCVHNYFNSLSNFDGNPQGFRIVTRIQWLNDEYGLNLTCSLLASMIKYLFPYRVPGKDFKKVGYFLTEASLVGSIWAYLKLNYDDEMPQQRHPLAFVMEAADDIAYSISDIEDAIEKGIVREEEFLRYINDSGLGKFCSSTSNQTAKNGAFLLFKIALTRHFVDSAAKSYLDNEDLILEGSFSDHLLDKDEVAVKAREALSDFARTKIYMAREVVNIEVSGFRILQVILSGLLPLLKVSAEQFTLMIDKKLKKSDAKHLALEYRLSSLLPNKALLVCRHASEKNNVLEIVYRTQLIVDYVAGMTDNHAVEVFRIINGTGV